MGTNSKRVTVRIVVSGRVQGVSFRASLHERALQSGLDGWVRNRNDGSVEALLQGDGEAVARVVEWSWTGPPRAEVTDVTAETLDAYPRQKGFRIAA
jgi:acylphosphatase